MNIVANNKNNMNEELNNATQIELIHSAKLQSDNGNYVGALAIETLIMKRILKTNVTKQSWYRLGTYSSTEIKMRLRYYKNLETRKLKNYCTELKNLYSQLMSLSLTKSSR